MLVFISFNSSGKYFKNRCRKLENYTERRCEHDSYSPTIYSKINLYDPVREAVLS